MGQRTRLRRKIRRARPQVRRSAAGTQPLARTDAKRGQGASTGVMIGGAQDPAEKAADRTAERVMRMSRPVPLVQRKCAECAEEEKDAKRSPVKEGDEQKVERKPAGDEEEEVQAKASPKAAPVAPGASASPASAGAAKAIGSLGGGRPLAKSERAFFEPRLGADLSPVRVHEGAAADRASNAISARAFAHGNDVAFARGEYAPGTDDGRRLMAHELAHVVGEGPARRSVRREEKVDPLCDKYDFVVDKLLLEGDVETLAKGGDTDDRLKVIEGLKIFHRCASPEEIGKIKTYLADKLGEEEAGKVWKSAGTAFGGYRGVYPGYYSGKKYLSGLGAEAEPSATFKYPEPTIDDAIFGPRGEKAATDMADTIERTDILYFYGHQYAQYGNPGAFANGTQDKFVDLRKLAGKGDFSRVKLIISTSCATICKEAIEVFAPLFPNAVILGYRKSAPLDGAAVRSSFDKGIKGLKKPLLLNEPVDVAAIINVWKSVVKGEHPKDTTRLPGYYKDGTVNYLKNGKWDTIAGTDAANGCKKKGTQIQQAR